MSFIIKNSKGEYWTGMITSACPVHELVMDKDLSQAERFSEENGMDIMNKLYTKFGINMISLCKKGWRVEEIEEPKQCSSLKFEDIYLNHLDTSSYNIKVDFTKLSQQFQDVFERSRAVLESQQMLHPKFPDHIPFVPYPDQPQIKYKPRPFNDLCKEASANPHYQELISIFAYVEDNKQHYTEIQYNFLKEFIDEKIEKIRSKETMRGFEE